MEPPAVSAQSPKALGEQLAPRPPTKSPGPVHQQEPNEDVAMTEVPEEKKENIPAAKEKKKKVQWSEGELKQSEQQQQKAPETLVYRPK